MRINVTYVLSSTTTYGGGTKSFMTLLEGAIKYGVAATLVVPDKQGIYEELKKMGLEVIVLNYRYSIYPYLHSAKDYILFLPRLFMRKFLNWRASRQLTSILTSRCVDIIHTNVSVIDIGFKAAKHLGVPHIYHFREYADKDFDMHYFPTKKRFYHYIDHPWSYNICITKDIQRHHQQQNCKRSKVIYDAVLNDSPTLKIDTKDNYFLYAGRIDASKGLDMLLHAYQKAAVDVPLYVAGDVRDMDYYETQKQFLREHHLDDMVKFLGQVHDLPSLMRKALAIVIPSRFEGFGRCMPEAMFYGCLSIGRNTGGTKEQLDNGMELEKKEIGLRFDNTEQLASQIKLVASNSFSDFIPYIERAYHTVNQLYSLEANSNAIHQLYHDIINDTTH